MGFIACVDPCVWRQSPGVLGWKGLSDFTFTFHFHALEKEMATHSRLRWKEFWHWVVMSATGEGRAWGCVHWASVNIVWGLLVRFKRDVACESSSYLADTQYAFSTFLLVHSGTIDAQAGISTGKCWLAHSRCSVSIPRVVTGSEAHAALPELTLTPIVAPQTHRAGGGNQPRTPGPPEQRDGKGIKTAKVLTQCIYTPKCFAVIRSGPFMRYK